MVVVSLAVRGDLARDERAELGEHLGGKGTVADVAVRDDEEVEDAAVVSTRDDRHDGGQYDR